LSKDREQLLLFKEISGKKVQVDFDGGAMSSDGGLLLFRQAELELGILDRVIGVLPDRRHPGYVKHHLHELARQRVFQIISGYEDGNDCNHLRNDPVMKMMCERLPISGAPLASQPTMSRFENALSRTDLYRMAKALLEVFIATYPKAPEGIILDFDDTADATHGHQQLSLFNAFHDTHCYMPLHIYEGKSGKLITTILRPGKRPKGTEVVAILKRIVKTIRAVWPEVGIIFRGDSHYTSPELFDYCRGHNVKFVVGLTPSQPMLKNAERLVEQVKECYELDHAPSKRYGEFDYQAASWSAPQRVIVKAEYNDKGANTRLVVTNLEHSNRKFIYQGIYSDRGRMELMIKEHKTHLHSDRTSCHRFTANQFRLLLHSIAYVLLHAFREKYLGNTQFATAQFNTIRTRLLKIGARVRQLATRVKISLPSSTPVKDDFYNLWRLCCPQLQH